ncbi:MAG: hypothetical protein K5767_02675 [Clostridia bacterium]|nr:hypothetical protein [Clostridia bacterium]
MADFIGNENEETIFINGKPLQIGSWDEYHFCMPDTRYFDVAEVLVLELSFACIVIKNIGMRGEDKKYRMVDGKKVPLSELEFVHAGVDTCNLQMALDEKYTGAYILFDGQKRERMLFGHIGL